MPLADHGTTDQVSTLYNLIYNHLLLGALWQEKGQGRPAFGLFRQRYIFPLYDLIHISLVLKAEPMLQEKDNSRHLR